MYCHERRETNGQLCGWACEQTVSVSPWRRLAWRFAESVRLRAGLVVPKVLHLCQVQLIQCQCGRGLLRRSLTKQRAKRTSLLQKSSAGERALRASRSGRSGHAWAAAALALCGRSLKTRQGVDEGDTSLLPGQSWMHDRIQTSTHQARSPAQCKSQTFDKPLLLLRAACETSKLMHSLPVSCLVSWPLHTCAGVLPWQGRYLTRQENCRLQGSEQTG